MCSHLSHSLSSASLALPPAAADAVVPCTTVNADWDGKNCVCRWPNAYVDNRACCGAGGFWDAMNKRCACPAGTSWVEAEKRCVGGEGGGMQGS